LTFQAPAAYTVEQDDYRQM